MKKKRIAILASGGGTNAQAIIDACENGILANHAVVSLVVSNNSNAGVLKRANKHGIFARHVSEKTCDSVSARLQAMFYYRKIDLVVLAGYMKKIEASVVRQYQNRILNIHPALLPKHGGKGMYGLHVHQSVINSGDRTTGPTVHLVNEHYDKGDILRQIVIDVPSGATAEDLQKLVLPLEHELYPMIILEIFQNWEHYEK